MTEEKLLEIIGDFRDKLIDFEATYEESIIIATCLKKELELYYKEEYPKAAEDFIKHNNKIWNEVIDPELYYRLLPKLPKKNMVAN